MTDDAAERAEQARDLPNLDAWAWVARARAAARRAVEPAEPAAEDALQEPGDGAETAPV